MWAAVHSSMKFLCVYCLPVCLFQMLRACASMQAATTSDVIAHCNLAQFSFTASAAELKDPFEVGCTHGTGKVQGNDLRNFLRDKLIRTFVKKAVSAGMHQVPCTTHICAHAHSNTATCLLAPSRVSTFALA